MVCQLSGKSIEKAIEFHGHSCPGLAIGIRAAEYALKEFPGAEPADLVCITETDMCGVDGIQFLTGCTFGKGNLIHRDFGKAAFSFYDRRSKKAFRILLQPDTKPADDSGLGGLMKKKRESGLTAEEEHRAAQLRDAVRQEIMNRPLEQMFAKNEIEYTPPRSARILPSLSCDDCGEKTMESRTRRFLGSTLCIPCFEKVEQKI